ncbi:uncharacterized protein LOC126670319 [Mercurialis annua]|uniref:uncharacterized protein LOC126670319 n=1 Tax=Mercurialis annua TaxID=3986 RepID=UPI00215E919B|nr:uncharacterized protein LOC126670319 [Mercurialis annua]
MPCHEVKSWTFVGLVGAFLDLAIVFLVLCASTLAFFVSKFLGLFRLSLPCPCNGLFGDPNSGKCWQRVLVNCPSEKLSSVQFSVKNKFPFDSIWDKNLNPESDKNCEYAFGGLNDVASSSSFQERVSERSLVKEENFDAKGKGIWHQKVRNAIRRRKKGAADNGRFSSGVSFDSFQSDTQALPRSPSSVNKTANESNEDSRDFSMDMDFLGRQSTCSESNECTKDKKPTGKDGSHVEHLDFNLQGKLSDGNDEKNTIRVLEHALEEEQAARSALYIELEKEQNAAASAADEAMAMILRLQEEKASIEMEARQYQRMIEEKSAYDFEEMNILKEILLRREKEKHFLEKENEAYRQMIFGSDQLDPDCETDSTGNANRSAEYEVLSMESQSHSFALGKEMSIPEFDKVHSLKQITTNKYQQHLSSGNEEINDGDEKIKLLLPEKMPVPQAREAKFLEVTKEPTAEGFSLQEKKLAALVEEVQQQTDVIDTSRGSSYFNRTCDETNNMDSCVHDIHMVDNKSNTCDEVGSRKQSENICLDMPRSCNSPVLSRSKTEQYISRSCSEITSGLPPRGFLQKKPLLSDLRRNSMSAVDYERFKIDNEVGWLREKLRIIQEGREKLNISMDHREKENIQLQLLENIVSQLQEIRQTTESGNVIRRVSLPPQSFKIMSKKRRCRSVSLEVHRSN